ncbi:hypothetical protein [Natronococcus sp. A-GB7]|jgi:hypothetical protein|uniref:hypothetical protein n=1 Tax=Natronococcus sp. A-GB7 TaxID=3037649 RepID=UPI00241F29AA|nr:hypothetical protein [Natronococcus sp. A-GB7]MDG5820537.1 hypothetical protein [Natronococcus sp. A-GB7]
MVTVLETLGSTQVVTGVLLAAAAAASLVLLDVLPNTVLWVSLIAALFMILVEFSLLVRTKLAV